MLASPSGASEVSNYPEYPDGVSLQSGPQQVSPQQYSAPVVPNFVTPAMWQQSVASVYEGGLKRSWDYDGSARMKRH
jgi:hypothetical protein